MKKALISAILLSALMLCSCGEDPKTDKKGAEASSDVTTTATTTETADDTTKDSSFGAVDSQKAIGTTARLEPGQTVDPLDVDGDGWMDVYV